MNCTVRETQHIQKMYVFERLYLSHMQQLIGRKEIFLVTSTVGAGVHVFCFVYMLS